MQMSLVNRISSSTLPAISNLRAASSHSSRRAVKVHAKSEEPAESSSGQDSYSVSFAAGALRALQLL